MAFAAEYAPVREFRRRRPPSMTGSRRVQSSIGQFTRRMTAEIYAEFAKVRFWNTTRSGCTEPRNASSASMLSSISSGTAKPASMPRSSSADASNCAFALSRWKVGTPAGM